MPRAGVLGVLIALSWFSVSPRPIAAPADAAGARTLRVEQWLKGVLHHTPGASDAAVLEVSAWSNSQLEILHVDESVLVQLMRDPRLVSFHSPRQETVDCNPCIEASETPQPRRVRPPQPIHYTDLELHRLKVLACAAAGTMSEPACVRLKAPMEIDAELSRLAALAATAKERGDNNYVLRRGALLHADAAMIDSNRLAPLNAAGPTKPVRVHIADGQPTEVGLGEIHWEIARLLLDAVRPEHDAMVSLWYRATAAWMQSREQYNNTHLDHARERSPNDADILFLSGCERETDAGPALQSVARSAALPAGVTLGIASERAALREAEAFFRRALALNPRLVEGRIRLGHVLLARRNAQDAAETLRPAVAAAGDPLLQYFGEMFLGAAEETLGHLVEARNSYAQAARLYPRAQSPYLALSALATRRGDRAGALHEVGHVFDLRGAAAEREDPWWTYHVAQARNADELLEQLWRPFREARP